ncbi:MAG TPA: nickel transporter [Streptomyces sp.]|nr:nickel transporter [Streptomyces sp.]
MTPGGPGKPGRSERRRGTATGLRRRAALLVGVLCAALLLLGTTGAPHAAAHPLGNFTVNTYDGLVLSPEALRIDHVEDFAEIPAAQAEPRIDKDADSRLTRAELAAYAREMCERAARRSSVTADGSPLRLASDGGRARALRRPGQAGLRTLRLECLLTARLALPDRARGTDIAVRFTGGLSTGADGPGWRETTARGDRATLTASDVPGRSVSGRLTRYPDGLLNSPLEKGDARLRVRAGGPALAPGAEAGPDAAGTERALPRGTDALTERFTDLVGGHRRLTVGFGALALALAAVLGAAHALAPGHGKTVMAAYAAGQHRSLGSLLRIGGAVTVTHTAGVLLLGAFVAAGSQATPFAIPWLTVLSGLLVAVAGAALLRRARAHHHGHGHSHGHGHGHGHGFGHDHGHRHQHSVSVEVHGPARPPRTRDSLLLGFAGGLVPSPSAVLVLVGSSALGRLWFGLLLVLAYGVGLAFTLVSVALLLVRAGDRIRRRLTTAPRYARLSGFVHRTAPTGTAALVVLLGTALVLRGLFAAAA